jgi:hypothetical protein
MKHKWNDDEKFLFATQKLRAVRVPNKKKVENKRACRGRVAY